MEHQYAPYCLDVRLPLQTLAPIQSSTSFSRGLFALNMPCQISAATYTEFILCREHWHIRFTCNYLFVPDCRCAFSADATVSLLECTLLTQSRTIAAMSPARCCTNMYVRHVAPPDSTHTPLGTNYGANLSRRVVYIGPTS